METQEKRSTWLVAVAVVGTVFTGILGLVAALIAFFLDGRLMVIVATPSWLS